mmetsp:Transcript_93711/g.201110  ORF Transcript_93711/g.201110 Transcript_93711/m.201110 type:complete len:204 (+) Transcript_93711:44-655(+)
MNCTSTQANLEQARIYSLQALKQAQGPSAAGRRLRGQALPLRLCTPPPQPPDHRLARRAASRARASARPLALSRLISTSSFCCNFSSCNLSRRSPIAKRSSRRAISRSFFSKRRTSRSSDAEEAVVETSLWESASSRRGCFLEALGSAAAAAARTLAARKSASAADRAACRIGQAPRTWPNSPHSRQRRRGLRRGQLPSTWPH